jgi:hypothetical protein
MRRNESKEMGDNEPVTLKLGNILREDDDWGYEGKWIMIQESEGKSEVKSYF